MSVAPTRTNSLQCASRFIGYDPKPRVDEAWPAWEGHLRVSDRVLSAVVFLGIKTDGRFTPLGTGFLATKNTGGRLFQHIVTARHVVELAGGKNICVRINNLSGGVELTDVPDGDWEFHPEEAVDVAICPTDIPLESYDIGHVQLDKELLSSAVVDKFQFGAGDDVFMVGMFTRHIGDVLNRPIVRTGTIAAMPAEKIETNRGLVHAYLVEARSMAGLSGSPVFLHVAPLRMLPGGNVSVAEGMAHYFLGVMQGHYVTQDPVDVASPDEEYSPGDMNTGIGVVIPAQRVMEVVDLPKLRDERERIVEKMRRESGFIADSATQEPHTKADNQSHAEDFNHLLTSVATGKPRDGQT